MSTVQTNATDWSSLCAEAMESVQQVEMPGNFQIPALPTSLTRFVEASKSPDADMRKLGAIIEHDPGLSLDLLRFVNAAVRATSNPARTPTDALIRLGIPTTRNFLLSAGIKSTTLGLRSKLMNHHNFWNESLRRAVFARSVAGRLRTDVEIAFMGGLLQDFMLPVLTNAFDDQYVAFLELETPQHLIDWEDETFGWNHASIAACMAHRWHLPEDLVCAIFFHHQMEVPLLSPAPDVFNLFPVTMAALLPDQLKQVPEGMSRLLEAHSRSRCFDLLPLCDAVDQELREFCDPNDRPTRLKPIMERAVEEWTAAQQAENGDGDETAGEAPSTDTNSADVDPADIHSAGIDPADSSAAADNPADGNPADGA